MLYESMKLNNEIKNKFDDIDGKIDFAIELCQTLQQENSDLMLKIEDLEMQLDKKKCCRRRIFRTRSFDPIKN